MKATKQIANKWLDYECIDAGNKEKLERWNNVILRRPDPSAIWPLDESIKEWKTPHAIYHRSQKGGGHWEYHKELKSFWKIKYNDLCFKVSPTDFKHTGLFPEQAVNWDWMQEKIKNTQRPIKVLNLFAYTGGATMACSAAGAEEVVHVDASKGMVQWAKENMKLSKLENNTIRFIIDDVVKFVEREKRRGHFYDAIIMDPPSYGRGPNNELWKIEDHLYPLIMKCMEILSEEPLFFLINAYTTEFSPTALENIMKSSLLEKYPNYQIDCGPIGLPITKRDMVLPCGIYGRFYL